MSADKCCLKPSELPAKNVSQKSKPKVTDDKEEEPVLSVRKIKIVVAESDEEKEEEEETHTCTGCRKEYSESKFKNPKFPGRILKTCYECRSKRKARRESARCIHGINPYLCKQCKKTGEGGKGICDHFKEKSRCKICKDMGDGGGNLCDHDKRRTECEICKELGIGGGGLCDHNII